MTRVAMIVRTTLYSARGGDTIQVMQTARLLRQHGIVVDIILTNELINYSQYKLLHFFNITRPADILHHITKANLPFVISTILIDYSEYDKYHRKGLSGMLFRYLPDSTIEYLKVFFRWVKGNDKMMSLAYALKGQNKSIKEILKKAGLLLPNSTSEYKRLSQRYGCQKNHIIVPNGVDGNLFRFNRHIKKDPKMVLCVARIEGIKNQLNLIKALNNTDYTLFIIGAYAPNQFSYYESCRAAAADNIHFIEQVPQEALVYYYQKAKVHALPSWFETTGLSSLESAAMGCNIVITDKGDTQEYFGNHAEYCSPESPDSIFAAIEKASVKPRNDTLRLKIANDYTWQKASMRTAEGYFKTIHQTGELPWSSSEPPESAKILPDLNAKTPIF
jgi:glycosyltransferase involved in cell wall biosynthesis